MSKKIILVTGGAGYVGSVLVPKLLESGYDVRIFDNLLFGTDGMEEFKDKIELVVGDILQPPKDLMNGVFAVIHLAGVSSQAGAAYKSPRYTDLMNHVGTEIVAKTAKAAGVERFVLASSCSIYCSFKHTPITAAPLYTEESHVNIFNPYSLSKRAAEEALLELADDNFAAVILRKGTLYGFSPKMRYDLVLNSFTKDAYKDKVINVNAGGEIWRPMVDIQDVVVAYVQSLQLPLEVVRNQIFNVVNTNQKIGDLADKFKNVLKQQKNIDIDLNIKPFEVMLNYQASNEKFKKVFNYSPIRTVKDAILETWDRLEKGHDLKNPKFYNDAWYAEAWKQGLIKPPHFYTKM